MIISTNVNPNTANMLYANSRKFWLQKPAKFSKFDPFQIKTGTEKNTEWIHFVKILYIFLESKIKLVKAAFNNSSSFKRLLGRKCF